MLYALDIPDDITPAQATRLMLALLRLATHHDAGAATRLDEVSFHQLPTDVRGFFRPYRPIPVLMPEPPPAPARPWWRFW